MKTILPIFFAALALAVAARGEVVFEDDFKSGVEKWEAALPDHWEFIAHNDTAYLRGKFEEKPGEGEENRFASASVALPASGGFNAVLEKNTGRVRWSFVLQDFKHEAPGLTGNGDGLGVVLAASSAKFRTEGNGYAVIKGGGAKAGGNTTALQFISYAGGLAGKVTPLATWADAKENPDKLSEFSNQRLIVLVEFDPAKKSWMIKVSNPDAESGGDTGTLKPVEAVDFKPDSVKTCTDSAFTGSELRYFGFFRSSDDSADAGLLKNVKIEVTK